MKKFCAVSSLILCSLIAFQVALKPAHAANMPNSNEIVAMLQDIKQYGYDNDPRINNGLGGLYINWRVNTTPLQTNFSGSGTPDVINATTAPRYDRLTDLRYLHALLGYKRLNPKDTQFDSEITKYTAIIKTAFGGSTDDRGWVYDEMSAIADLSGDVWFTNWIKNLANYYDTKLFKPAIGASYKTDSAHPNGFYRVDLAIEQGAALIQAGVKFNNAKWQADGATIINFTYDHAYVAQYHVLLYQMTNVLLPNGKANPNETIDQTDTNDGGRVVMGSVAQTIVALLDAFTASKAQTYMDRAADLLMTFDSKADRLGMWDNVNGGYFKQASFTGADFQNPGTPVVDTTKKEVGRQAQMLQAYAMAYNINPTTYYKMMHAMTQSVTASLSVQGKWTGVQYEVRPNWSSITNKNSASGVEDWMTSEAMGIVLISLESLAK